MIARSIVGEVSVNWQNDPAGSLVSERFELLINENARHGFLLVSWQLVRVALPSPEGNFINETIVAVFTQPDLPSIPNWDRSLHADPG